MELYSTEDQLTGLPLTYEEGRTYLFHQNYPFTRWAMIQLCVYLGYMSPKPEQEMCTQKVRLTAEWADATTTYAKTLQLLLSEKSKIRNHNYEHLQQATEAARYSAERSQKALELHILTHGC